MLRIGIVGSRRYTNKELVVKTVNDLPEGVTIVSGGCKGPDKWAEEAAVSRGLDVKIFEPYFRRKGHEFFGKYAVWHFFARNAEIADDSDVVMAFYDGKSGGTHDTVTKARKKGKLVITIL